GMSRGKRDVSVRGTWAWAQFMTRWPPPGPTMSTASQSHEPVSRTASDWPDSSANGVTTASAISPSAAWYSTAERRWRARLEATKYHVHAANAPVASASPARLPPAASVAPNTTTATPAMATAVQKTSTRRTSSPNSRPTTSKRRAGWRAEMMEALATDVRLTAT